MQKGKWLSVEALKTTEKRREVKGEGERKLYPSKCRFPKNSEER